MEFLAVFEGAPPYVLDYIILKQNGSFRTVVKRERGREREYTDRSRHKFYYLPNSSGVYTYNFHSFGDLHHKYQPTQIALINQTFDLQPDAKFNFSFRRALRTCPGEGTLIDVNLSGTGPFELSWRHANQTYSDKAEENRYQINLNPFGSAGHHVISLVIIEDVNGCVED